MSHPKEPRPVKLIAGLLFQDFEVQQRSLKILCDRFGPMDFMTQPIPFTYTDYYKKEMGPTLYRQICSFLELAKLDTLAESKLFTNEVEIAFSHEGKRTVNIDPGFLSEERIVLATGKNYTHRIYLHSGIFADLTMIYQDGAYRSLPWTYPDYQEPILLHYFSVLRQKLIFQRNGKLPNRAIN